MSQKTISDKDVLLSLGMDSSSYSESQVQQALSIMKKAAKVISEVVVNPSSIDSFDGKLEEYGIPKGKMRELVHPFLELGNEPPPPPPPPPSSSSSSSSSSPVASSAPTENRTECELITKKEFAQFQERIFSLLQDRLHNPVKIITVVKEDKTVDEKEKIEDDDEKKEDKDKEKEKEKEKEGEESDEDDSEEERKKKRRMRAKRIRPICDLSRFSHIVEQSGNIITWRASTGVNICLREVFTRGIYNITFKFRKCLGEGGNITIGVCTPEWASTITEGQFMGNDSGSLDWNRKEGIFHDHHRSEAPKFEDDEEISLEVDMNRRMLFFFHRSVALPLCYTNIPPAVKVGFYMNKLDASCVLAVTELRRSAINQEKQMEYENVSW